MTAANTTAIILDLDDTIVRFSAGRSQLWLEVLTDYAPLLQGAEPVGIARTIDTVVSPQYWGDPQRAVWGQIGRAHV